MYAYLEFFMLLPDLYTDCCKLYKLKSITETVCYVGKKGKCT